MTFFADTGGFYAVEDVDDQHHADAEAFLSLVAEDSSIRILTTNFVLSETLTLVRMRLGHASAVDFRERVIGSSIILVERVSVEDEDRAWRIFARYSDKAFSYVDCTSFAVMERHRLDEAFAFDQHFVQYGFELVPT